VFEDGKDKKASAKAPLDKGANEPNLRDRLEREAIALEEVTSAGGFSPVCVVFINEIPVIVRSRSIHHPSS
jgi:hypothetical protein